MISSILPIARSCSEYHISKIIWPNKSMKELIMDPLPSKKDTMEYKKFNIIATNSVRNKTLVLERWS
jgi:hypothetical protein